MKYPSVEGRLHFICMIMSFMSGNKKWHIQFVRGTCRKPLLTTQIAVLTEDLNTSCMLSRDSTGEDEWHMPSHNTPTGLQQWFKQAKHLMQLDNLITALQQLNNLDPEHLPTHHAAIFCFIASKPSCTYRDIEEHFGVSNASVSRTINSIGTTTGHRWSVLGLVYKFPDPEDGRRFRVKLTKKGLLLKQQLAAL